MEKVYFSVVWLSKVRGSVKQIVLIPAIDCIVVNDLTLLWCRAFATRLNAAGIGTAYS